ncbi:hypothetical protein BC477_12630 [Clavibacter michiganensis subsp. michiganensis]|uniref:Uncharacterized protein n=1 Tax=Clavibacter michiganensis subsp. michiganensis TaxID=33013 RepID=A0A251XIC7_CLAMM|nr:hypothetical protein BC477_12630 [Clavibacter michiganensis subsp. michiganensis]OUE02643.1 hypothetical protein CMMCAS07_11535 [Clavibacter michiganensis subsp. michiganensis]
MSGQRVRDRPASSMTISRVESPMSPAMSDRNSAPPDQSSVAGESAADTATMTAAGDTTSHHGVARSRSDLLPIHTQAAPATISPLPSGLPQTWEAVPSCR